MGTLKTVEEVLGASSVIDVLVPGWVDRDDVVPEFRPQPQVIWLRLPDGFLRLEAVEHAGNLVAHRVTELSWSDIPLLVAAEDEDDIGEVLVASYGEQLFGDGDGEQGARCVELRAYVRDADHSLVCLALDFTYQRTVFLDPTWTFGIRIGNEAGEQRWLERERDATAISCAVTRFGADL
ncbi:hypothetical protein G5C51_24465 [Streptomyces sp. A7024]|uniref:Uncharacterized protein n=1 Tax=Streptomyces coryli TaxID=1128680 RepID=A0A6G4U482_9ACTN|nr:hypothetical protein [Streptomyces coryli]NGN67049.1 hypothetical protein [Streptomyces coryli]